MSILGLHHVNITVPSDAMDAARQFYVAELGLSEIEKPASLQARGGFWLRLGNLDLHVSRQDDIDRHALRAHVAFLVDDLALWRQKLSALGIDIIESVQFEGFTRFECRDPFSNRLEFIQPLDD